MILLIFYLSWGTGLVTDDFVHIWQALDWNLSENLLPREYASIPLLHYTQGLVFFLVGDRPWIYDIIKVVYLGAAVYFSSEFFRLFCERRRSLLLGFFLVFFPLHDAADYSLTMFYLIESLSFYLFAFALGYRGRFGLAVLFAVFGSFSSYGSPPIALGLAFAAFLMGRPRLLLAVLLPNLVYVAYYLSSSLIFKVGTARLIGEMTIPSLVKGFILEAVTFVDAAFGPSAWLKFFYSIASLNLTALVIAIAVSALAIFYIRKPQEVETEGRVPFAVVVSSVGIVILTFGMFTLTGLYPHIAFNLGDRIMVYGSFMLICVLASIRVPRAVESGIITFVVLAIVGISVHWKDWNHNVGRVAENIRANRDIGNLSQQRLFVSHNQFSRLGPFAHIEFFNPSYVVRAFFNLTLQKQTPFETASFNTRLEFDGIRLRDRKFGDEFPVREGIWLYNSEQDKLEFVRAEAIQSRLDALPDEDRHWTQMVENPKFKALMSWLFPRLSYAF